MKRKHTSWPTKPFLRLCHQMPNGRVIIPYFKTISKLVHDINIPTVALRVSKIIETGIPATTIPSTYPSHLRVSQEYLSVLP